MLVLLAILVSRALAQPCVVANTTCSPANSTAASLNTDPLICSIGKCICNFPLLDRIVAQQCTWIDFTGIADTLEWTVKLEANCKALLEYRQCLANVYGSCYAVKLNVANTFSDETYFAGKVCFISRAQGNFCRVPERTPCSVNTLAVRSVLQKSCSWGCKELKPHNASLSITATTTTTAAQQTTGDSTNASISSISREEIYNTDSQASIVTPCFVLVALAALLH